MTVDAKPLSIKWEDAPRDGALRGEGRESFTDENDHHWYAVWDVAIYPAQSGWNVQVQAAGFARRLGVYDVVNGRSFEPYAFDTRIGRNDYGGAYATLDDAKRGAAERIRAAHDDPDGEWYRSF